MDKKKLVLGGIMGVSVITAGMAGALVGMTAFPKEIIKSVDVIKNVTIPYPVYINQTIEKEVPVEIIKEIEKIVEVDNGNLDKALEFIKDEVDEDIDMDYILFEIDSKMEGEAYIKDNIVKLLDLEYMFDSGELLGDYRKSEISIRRISDPEVLYRDFSRKDLDLKYEVRIGAKKGSDRTEYFDLEVTIPFEKGKMVKEDIITEEI